MFNTQLRCARFTKAITQRRPEFFSPNTVAYESEILKLRFFGGYNGTPILIVPPQAGHHSSIADYDNGQSLVQTCLSATTQPVYCIEWLSATQATKNTSIEDLLIELHLAVHKAAGIMEPVNLIGLCQGGWLSTMFTALYQESVSKLTIAGAPIDTHAGGGALQEIVKKIPQTTYELMVNIGGGIMKGDLMLAGWKMMNFMDRYLIDFQKLWNATSDQEKVRKIERFRTWYEFTQSLAGEWYLWAIDKLFRKNQLVKKEIVINGDVVDLANISCPIAMIIGEADDITLPEQCLALADHVSTPKELQMMVRIPECGHIGVFMGGKSQKLWAQAVGGKRGEVAA